MSVFLRADKGRACSSDEAGVGPEDLVRCVGCGAGDGPRSDLNVKGFFFGLTAFSYLLLKSFLC